MILLSAVAFAEDCRPLDEARLRGLVADGKAAVDADDLVRFAEVRRTVLADLPCLSQPLPADAWARFLLDEAVVEYALGEAWQEPLGTALALDPDLPRGDLPDAIRDWRPPPPPADLGPLPPGTFLLDGRPLAAEPDLAGVHVVQRSGDGRWDTRYLRDAPFPEEWRAAAVAAPRERHNGGPWLATGAAIAVAGAAVGVGTWAVRGSVEDPAAADRLVVANVTGWSAAAAGAALVLGVGLHGRF